jgi:hypothetical protein
MSWYVDVVINCDLRPDVPQEYIDAIRYLTSPKGTVPLPTKPHTIVHSECEEAYDFWEFFEGDAEAFLMHYPEHGRITNFYRTYLEISPYTGPLYFYCLQYVGRLIVDDVWANALAKFFYWLPAIASDGLVGYHKSQYSNEVALLYAKNGRCVNQDGKPLFSDK